MRELAPGVFQLPLAPLSMVNAYVAGGVLVDAGTRFDARRILRAVHGHSVTTHALTHAHPDHQGASHAVCTALGLPLWCGDGDADAVEGTAPLIAPNPLTRVLAAVWAGPPHPVARRLMEGDAVGPFTVIETPGHSPGHVAFWHERERVLLVGDVLNGANLLTTWPGLREPPRVLTPDPTRNRASARKLIGLNPRVVGFGHGPPLRDAGRFDAFLHHLAA